LRLLENRELLPVGADQPVHADVLMVAATNQDLEGLVEAGRFRRDLFARLSMARIRLPPLRERREDIHAICRALASRLGITWSADATEVEAMERLLLDPWPSNVRGLMAAIGEIAGLVGKPGLRLWAVERVLGKLEAPGEKPLTEAMIQAALAACHGNQSQAARHLGISRGKLRRFLEKLESGSG
jgi:transcriptional regulator of acetoin/glycerol metabolism